MTLVQKLQEDILDDSKDLLAVLRRFKALSARLPECALLSLWLEGELEGYRRKDAIPRYRWQAAVNRGVFVHNESGELAEASIVLERLPAEVRPFAETLVLANSVVDLEGMIAPGDTQTRLPWPKVVVDRVADEVYPERTCRVAWKVVRRSDVTRILEGTRMKALNLLLALTRSDPEVLHDDEALFEVPGNRLYLLVARAIYDNETLDLNQDFKRIAAERLDGLLDSLSPGGNRPAPSQERGEDEERDDAINLEVGLP